MYSSLHKLQNRFHLRKLGLLCEIIAIGTKDDGVNDIPSTVLEILNVYPWVSDKTKCRLSTVLIVSRLLDGSS